MKNTILFVSALIGLTTFFSCSQDSLTEAEEILAETLAASDAELLTTYTELEAQMRGGDEKGGDFDKKGKKKKAIALDSLSKTIKDFITTNYAGATLHKAFADEKGNVVVFVTKADGTKVGLLFDAEGKFVKEVTKKPKGGHSGVKDSSNVVAIKDLPAKLTTYLSTNYAGYVVLNAHTEKDGSYDVTIKITDGKFVKLYFDKDGNFVKIAVKGATIVDVATLPVAITDYVAANYTGATIDKAAQSTNGEYLVSITTTASKKVRLLFDKNGVFIKVIK